MNPYKQAYQEYLTQQVCLAYSGFPFTDSLPQDVLTSMHQQIRNKGIPQEEINEWFQEIAEKAHNTQGLIAIKMHTGDLKFLFVEDMDNFIYSQMEEFLPKEYTLEHFYDLVLADEVFKKMCETSQQSPWEEVLQPTPITTAILHYVIQDLQDLGVSQEDIFTITQAAQQAVRSEENILEHCIRKSIR